MPLILLKPVKSTAELKEDLLQLFVVKSHVVVFSILGTITKLF